MGVSEINLETLKRLGLLTRRAKSEKPAMCEPGGHCKKS